MKALKARVQSGRLMLDVPTQLPEGSEVDLVVASGDDDDLSPEERAALHDALRASWVSAQAGLTRPAEDLLAELRARR